MKSDVIQIDNKGNGFDNAITETKKIAEFRGLNHKESLRLQIMAEEMLGLARSVTGEMQASFWVESEDKFFELHMTTKTVMDKEKRYQLLSSATSRKNEAANSFLGKLRDAFEEAMTAEADKTFYELPDDVMGDFVTRHIDDQEWDRYERSILRRLADDIKIAIKGGLVSMTVCKKF
jgi:hypothetical protein